MIYTVQTIKTPAQLASCPEFLIDNFLWNSAYQPKTSGRMALLEGKGLLIQMTCNEADPKREYFNHRNRVCEDSAVEAFLAFPDKALRQTAQPENDCMYFNFEVNANGSMYTKYGAGRKDRQFITEDECAATGIKANLTLESWSVEWLAPLELLKRAAGITGLKKGDVFFCNFYKISEDPAIEHYAAFSPIMNETPNFHLPRYFARAVIE